MLGILVAAISGAIMSVQGVFNAEVTKQTSIWLSSAFVQISAFVVCVLAWFITGRDGAISSLWHVSPKYMLLGGALGAFITALMRLVLPVLRCLLCRFRSSCRI